MEAGDGRHFWYWCWCWCEFQVTVAVHSPAFTRRADLAGEGSNRAGFLRQVSGLIRCLLDAQLVFELQGLVRTQIWGNLVKHGCSKAAAR